MHKAAGVSLALFKELTVLGRFRPSKNFGRIVLLDVGLGGLSISSVQGFEG